MPSAALTCFRPSWCCVKLRPPSTPAVDDDIGGVDVGGAVGGQPQHALGDVVGDAGAGDRRCLGVDLRDLGGRVLGLCGLHAQRLGENGRGDRTRRHGVDAHVVLAQLHADAARQVVHRRLRRAVDHRGRVSRLVPGDRAVVDDAAGSLLHHDRRRVLHAQHHRAHQQRHGRVETLDRDGGDAAGRRRTAGIVEHIVEAGPERLGGLGDQPFPVVLERGVGPHEAGAGPELGRQRLPFRLAPAGEHHLGALGDEQLGRARADAAGRTGDDSNFAVDHAHGVFLTRRGLTPCLYRIALSQNVFARGLTPAVPAPAPAYYPRAGQAQPSLDYLPGNGSAVAPRVMVCAWWRPSIR